MAIALYILIFAVFVIIITLFFICVKSRGHTSVKKKNNEYKALSYKQQMFRNHLEGDKTSPYSQATYILSQSGYDAYADFVIKLFGFKKGSKECDEKIFNLIKKYGNDSGNIKVLPDGSRDITYPRVSTDFLNREKNNSLLDFMRTSNGNVLFFYHKEKDSDLFDMIELYCEKKNIETKYAPKICSFGKQTNKYIEIDPLSLECAEIYYICIKNAKHSIGFKQHPLPSQKTIDKMRAFVSKKYKIESEYDFMNYLIPYYLGWWPMFYSFKMLNIERLNDIFYATRMRPQRDPALLKPYDETYQQIKKELRVKEL